MIVRFEMQTDSGVKHLRFYRTIPNDGQSPIGWSRFLHFPNASLFYKEQFLFSCHLFESAFAEFSFGLFTPWVKFAVFRVQSSMFHVRWIRV